MLSRLFRQTVILTRTYKRNPSLSILQSLNCFSTNRHNNKSMENTEELTQKVEQLKVEEPKVEEKTENKAEEKTEVKAEEKVNAKKEKKKKQEKPKAEKKEEAPVEDEIGPKLFSQIDIRVSEIVECWKHPESENLYCEKILVCGEVREIASGLQKFVPLEQMKGKVLVMANLKPRPLAGFNSNGMVVCASNAEHTAVELLIPEGDNGERVFLEGFEELFAQGAVQPLLNPKKKVLEKCAEHFKTDEEGNVTWKGIKVRTKAGVIKAATIRNGTVG